MQAECAATLLGGAVRTFRLAGIDEERGRLTPIEFADLNFMPVRAFIVEAPDGAVRGGHGHRTGRQLLVRLSGEVTIDVAHGREQHAIRLDGVTNGVLVAAPVWSKQTYHGGDARLLVLCDTPYDPASYITERE